MKSMQNGSSSTLMTLSVCIQLKILTISSGKIIEIGDTKISGKRLTGKKILRLNEMSQTTLTEKAGKIMLAKNT